MVLFFVQFRVVRHTEPEHTISIIGSIVSTIEYRNPVWCLRLVGLRVEKSISFPDQVSYGAILMFIMFSCVGLLSCIEFVYLPVE